MHNICCNYIQNIFIAWFQLRGEFNQNLNLDWFSYSSSVNLNHYNRADIQTDYQTILLHFRNKYFTFHGLISQSCETSNKCFEMQSLSMCREGRCRLWSLQEATYARIYNLFLWQCLRDRITQWGRPKGHPICCSFL